MWTMFHMETQESAMRNTVIPMLAAVGLLLVAPSTGWAADPCAGGLGAAQIVNCLKPNSLDGANRGIRAPGGTAVQPGAQQPPAAPTPSVNLLVPFGFDSATLSPAGRAALDALGTALKDPDLANVHFQIGGHTDATGTAAYNMELSRRRAEAARAYLVSHAGIDGSRLTAVGFGSTELYNTAAPDSAINRRVQVTRLGS
jgi:outer membrane protein OmpA-like peptidoglycan-associated protein